MWFFFCFFFYWSSLLLGEDGMRVVPLSLLVVHCCLFLTRSLLMRQWEVEAAVEQRCEDREKEEERDG